jgi:hypothetical protein
MWGRDRNADDRDGKFGADRSDKMYCGVNELI